MIDGTAFIVIWSSLGTLSGLDPTQAYTWTIASTSNLFGSASFTVDPSLVTNSNSIGTGTFSAGTFGNDIVANFSSVPEPST